MPCKRTGIAALFCDLGNVLVTFERRAEWLWKMAKLFNPKQLDGSPDLDGTKKLSFFDRLAKCRILDLLQDAEAMFDGPDTGRVTAEQVYAGFISAADVTRDLVPPERFWAAYDAHLVIVPQTCRLIQEIQARGVVLIAASNGNSWLTPDLLALTAGIRFDGVVLSWQIGCRKPGSDFYHTCRDRAEPVAGGTLTFPQCLLIDDTPSNIESFRQLNGHTIQFKASRDPGVLAQRIAVLKRQLAELGLGDTEE